MKKLFSAIVLGTSIALAGGCQRYVPKNEYRPVPEQKRGYSGHSHYTGVIAPWCQPQYGHRGEHHSDFHPSDSHRPSPSHRR